MNGPRKRQLGFVSFRWVAPTLTSVYAVISAGWITAWNLYFAGMVPEQLRMPGQSLYGPEDWLFVLITSVVLYFLLNVYTRRLARIYSGGADLNLEPGASLPVEKWTAVVFALLGTALAVTGYTTFAEYRAQVTAVAKMELAAIVRVRADEAARWVLERKRDARALAEDPIVSRTFAAIVKGNADRTHVSAALRSQLDTMSRVYNYRAIRMVGADGRARLTAPMSLTGVPLTPFARAMVLRAIEGRGPVLDGSPAEPGARHEVGLAMPLPANATTGQDLAGAIYLELKPESFLFPLLRTWPVPSATGEMVMLRHERGGNKYAFEPLRKSPARPLRKPDTLLAALGDVETTGTRRVDYRGEDVFMAAQPVAETPWVLVAKQDVAEVEGPLDRAGTWAAALALAALLAGGLITLLIWRTQVAGFVAANYRAWIEREALVRHYDHLTKFANDAFVLMDEAFVIREINDRAISLFGYARDELIGMQAARLRSPESRARYARQWLHARDPEGAIFEAEIVRKDGSTLPVEISARMIEVEGVVYAQAIVRDIHERKKALALLHRQRNLYDALSATNRAIVRCQTQEEIFREVCLATVERAGFLFAWVGLADAREKVLEPIVWHGEDQGYMQKLRVSLDANDPRGNGPGARAARLGTHQIVNNVAIDPRMEPWRADAESAGVCAMAAFPLRQESTVVGVFSVYAGKPGLFDDDTVELLVEMAADMSFALDNFVHERRRAAANATIKQAEERFRLAIEEAPFPALIHAEDGAILNMSRAWSDLSGYSIRDIPTLSDWTERAYGAAKQAVLDEIDTLYDLTQRKDEGEYVIRCKDGSLRVWSFSSVSLGRLEDGRRIAMSMAADFTERKRMETALAESAAQFRSVVEQSIAGLYIIQDGKFAYANPRFAEIAGYDSAEELIGLETLSLVAERDRALVAENLRRRLAGEVRSIAYSFLLRRKDGSTVDVGVHGASASYRGQPAIIGLLQDISERKRSEEQTRRYLAQLEAALMRTVEVATIISEMRDPYTAGHEKRVAQVAVALGRELGLDAPRLEGLRVAGHLHDIGKITIPAEILAKPGRLSNAEFELIKGHPEAGYNVLKDVEFPWPVAQVVRQHHERFDGSGYPQGLKGDAILYEARIMAVADVVEAMSSYRPYRPGLGIDKALAEIERGRGSAYDPMVADACLRLFREKGYAIPD